MSIPSVLLASAATPNLAVSGQLSAISQNYIANRFSSSFGLAADANET